MWGDLPVESIVNCCCSFNTFSIFLGFNCSKNRLIHKTGWFFSASQRILFEQLLLLETKPRNLVCRVPFRDRRRRGLLFCKLSQFITEEETELVILWNNIFLTKFHLENGNTQGILFLYSYSDFFVFTKELALDIFCSHKIIHHCLKYELSLQKYALKSWAFIFLFSDYAVLPRLSSLSNVCMNKTRHRTY